MTLGVVQDTLVARYYYAFGSFAVSGYSIVPECGRAVRNAMVTVDLSSTVSPRSVKMSTSAIVLMEICSDILVCVTLIIQV